MHTGPRLPRHLLTLRERLVVEHVGVPALLAEVGGERVPAHIVFSRTSSSRRDCATTDRGSACDGVRGTASLPPYA